MDTREYSWVSKIPVDYPYRYTRTGTGMSTSTIFIQRDGDIYHTTGIYGYPLTSLDVVHCIILSTLFF